MKKIHSILFFLLFITSSFANNAKETIPSLESIFDNLSYKEVLDITLKTDFNTLFEDKRKTAYQVATLSYVDQEGQSIERQVKVKLRGKYRRMNCAFPPLKVKFSKEDLAKDHLSDFNKLKLVTHCDEEASLAQTILKEYQTYKLYNTLSDTSFRVQLLNITYEDVDGSSFTQYGFFIESIEELADRVGGVESEEFNLQEEAFNQEQLKLVSTFQFMIGNSDWHIRRLKNVKLIRPSDGGKLIPVPYDFDFSGLVSAYYAIPSRDYPIRTVQERIYLGDNLKDLESTLLRLEDLKPSLLENCASFTQMEKSNRKAMTRYLLTFFRMIDDQDKWLVAGQ